MATTSDHLVTLGATVSSVSRRTGPGLAVAAVSAAAFATAGPFGKALLAAGWTPGSVVFLRVAGAALLLALPTARALRGRWRVLGRHWPALLAYGVMAVAAPQLLFYAAVERLPVGVALLLEYLGLVLVVAWQSVAVRRLPGRLTVVGVVLAVLGLLLVVDVASAVTGGQPIDGLGVVFALVAATGPASYFLLGERAGDSALPPIALAGGSLVVAAVLFAGLGAASVLSMRFPATSVDVAGLAVPWWAAVLELAAVAGASAYVSGIAAARLLGATLASFVGLTEVLFAVLFAWLLLGELPRMIQLLGGALILAGVVAVRVEGRPPGSRPRTSGLSG